MASAVAQRPNRVPRKPRHVYPAGVDKDNGEGARINFGLAFAPTFDWMYTKTLGHQRDGIVVGMRYGVPINVNLTHGKNFYVSTGVFLEHVGGKLALRDSVILPNIGGTEADIHRTYRAMYLTIPVGITLKTNSINNFSWRRVMVKGAAALRQGLHPEGVRLRRTGIRICRHPENEGRHYGQLCAHADQLLPGPGTGLQQCAES